MTNLLFYILGFFSAIVCEVAFVIGFIVKAQRGNDNDETRSEDKNITYYEDVAGEDE